MSPQGFAGYLLPGGRIICFPIVHRRSSGPPCVVRPADRSSSRTPTQGRSYVRLEMMLGSPAIVFKGLLARLEDAISVPLMVLTGLLSILLSFSFNVPAGAQSRPPNVIDTGYAKYRGNLTYSNTVAYLGVPYAEPPVGQRRFRAPLSLNSSRVAAETGGKVVDASEYPDFCVQGGLRGMSYSSDDPTTL